MISATGTVCGVLVRYGTMGEVARFAADDLGEGSCLSAGNAVVVESSRGHELGTVLAVESGGQNVESLRPVVRLATAADVALAAVRRSAIQQEYQEWQQRITDWALALQLIDAERTLDGEKLILYVLNDRGPETTQLALRAATAGFGVIEVQPVGGEGVRPVESKGGCGSGGCRH